MNINDDNIHKIISENITNNINISMKNVAKKINIFLKTCNYPDEYKLLIALLVFNGLCINNH